MLARLIPLLLAACIANIAGAEPIQIDTARGPATVPEDPSTVAVFDIAAIDTLNALGVPIAGTTSNLYVDYLQNVADDSVKLGSLFEPDVEGVHALQPDLIVIGGRSSGQLKSLDRIAPTIDMTIGIDLLQDAVTRLHTYGQIFDREERAADLALELNDRLARAREAVSGKGDALVIMTNGPKISAYGSGGRFGWLHKDVGLAEAAPAIGASIHGEAVSFEFISDVDPDWLIVVDRLSAIGRPGQSAAATLDNPIVHKSKAWKSGQVIYLDAAEIYISGGGVQSMMTTLDQIIAAFSPA